MFRHEGDTLPAFYFRGRSYDLLELEPPDREPPEDEDEEELPELLRAVALEPPLLPAVEPPDLDEPEEPPDVLDLLDLLDLLELLRLPPELPPEDEERELREEERRAGLSSPPVIWPTASPTFPAAAPTTSPTLSLAVPSASPATPRASPTFSATTPATSPAFSLALSRTLSSLVDFRLEDFPVVAMLTSIGRVDLR